MNKLFYLGIVLGLVLVSACGDDSRPSKTGARTIPAAELTAAVSDGTVKAFYEKQGWSAVWSKKNEQQLKEAMGENARHGLDRLAFWPELNGLEPAAREAKLTEAALRYAGALAHGVADPSKLYEIYTLRRSDTDVAAGLQQAVHDGDVGAWLRGLVPQDAEYAALSDAYLEQRKEASSPQSGTIAPGEPLKPGVTDARVPKVRKALSDNGYLTPAKTVAGGGDDAGQAYTPDVAAAVKALQADFGITADGVVGPDTLAVLNMGPADRARALAVALERMRWLSRTPPAERIDVNTAAAELRYFKDGKVADQRKVISGRPGNETPQLETPIYRLAANPTWTLPRSIEGEITSKGKGYMSRNGFSWRDGRLVQKSGEQNALGLVKFDMKNEHAIYLHDTPAKTLFGKHQRQLSHGCVRVDNALEFAEKIAADHGVTAQWAEARATGKETFVPLAREIPVRLIYQTAFTAEGGGVLYRTDPYGWDDAVAKALGFDTAARNRFRTDLKDTGP